MTLTMSGPAVTMAYADPPYLGSSMTHYGDLHEDAADYDDPRAHQALIGRLCDEYPAGWALSLHTPSLQRILPMCPTDVRVGAWVKPFHALKRGVRPSYGWEPVIFRGGRQGRHRPPEKGGKATTPRDWVSAPIAMQRGFPGAKPEPFCLWLFDLLGLRRDDELHDLFPGSGAVSRAWRQWSEMPEALR